MKKYLSLFLLASYLTACTQITKEENRNVDLSHLPQNTSEVSNIPIQVKGEIPPWLNGMYIRNGAGILEGKSGPVKHWFDGLAKLEAFTIDNGQVTYSCQFLKSAAYERYKQTGDFDFNGFAQKSIDETFSLMDFLLGSKNEQINNANVNVAKINQKFVALTEVPLPVEFDKNLHTVGCFDYDDNLPKNFIFESAHVLNDPSTKETWNFLIKIGLFKTSYQIYQIPNQSSARKLIASIPVSSISYMHSFSLAGKYFVLIDYPFRSDHPKDLAYNFSQAFTWQKNTPSLIYVVDRNTGAYQTFETEPLFSFHHVNAFEKDNKLYIDLIAYPNADIVWDVNKYPFLKTPNSKLKRLEVDLQNSTTKLTQLLEDNIEFPRINDSVRAKEYKHLYAIHSKEDGNGLIKYSHPPSKPQYWAEKNCYANEPTFVPRPGGKLEDDGVVISLINNLKTKKSFLLILDAKDFKELAKIEAPHLIPFGFHGQFFN